MEELLFLCRCWMFVVQHVMILSAMRCVVWILFRLVSEMIGDQRVFSYSMMDRAFALYVVMSVSFCLPQAVDVSAYTTLSDFSAFSLVTFMCSPKLSFGSNVSPIILGFYRF